MEEKLLDEWQERLGLQDWAIRLNYNCKREDMQDATTTGETIFNLVHKAARISIISEEEHGKLMLDYDFEKTLVHELLHCKLAMLDYPEGTKGYERDVLSEYTHQLVDDLARAFVMAKRNETKRKLAEGCPRTCDAKEEEKE